MSRTVRPYERVGNFAIDIDDPLREATLYPNATDANDSAQDHSGNLIFEYVVDTRTVRTNFE